jgi:hypothetical protein
MKYSFIEDEDFDGRYISILEGLLNELGAIKELDVLYEGDCYYGEVDCSVLLKDGRVFSYYYSYGSCAGCDSWDGRELEDEEIKQEMKKEATYFDNIEQYNEWKKNRNI